MIIHSHTCNYRQISYLLQANNCVIQVLACVLPCGLGLADKVTNVSGNLRESGAKKGAQPLAEVIWRQILARS